jgi:hypothetical protein
VVKTDATFIRLDNNDETNKCFFFHEHRRVAAVDGWETFIEKKSFQHNETPLFINRIEV